MDEIVDGPPADELFYVGIGASAGGLEAASSLVQNLPAVANAVYILAQHMSPTHKSLLTSLISRETPLPVVELTGETVPTANTFFITPPNTDVILEDGLLKLVEPGGHTASPKPSADRLFKSLAHEQGQNCVGVVLSGTGSDGSYGVQAIREAGGITIAQDISTAKYDGMPASAAETGCIDLTLSPEQIGQHLEKILARPRDFGALRRLNERPSKLSDLFQILLARTSVDFRDYKETTVSRRINRRMAALDIEDYDEYVAYCRASVEEVDALYRDLLISVTRFFRDRGQFEQLRNEFEKMTANREIGQLRLWVAGCATGEEVYSIAIMLAEAMGGIEELSKSRIQIFATDIDDRALEVARRGIYPITAASDIPEEFLDKYFKVHDGQIEVMRELRDLTLFSLHNIFQDPPFLNLDFVSLRNVLIYFNTALQNRILHRIHYALNPSGFLFLGTSESVGNMESLFETRSGTDKIYSKRRLGMASSIRPEIGNPAYGRWIPAAPAKKMEDSQPGHFFDAGMFSALARSVAPNGFILTRSGEIVRVYGDISPFTQLTENAPLWIGIRSLRKSLRDEISGLFATALKNKERRTGRWHDLDGAKFNQARSVCYPLPSTEDNEDHVLVAIETRMKDTPFEELEAMSETEQHTYIRQMELEIAQTREALQQTVEELQTSNEELQSINEEMQSTNEELQATNEELETSNEELQSTNEELITVNEELQVNSHELQRVSTDLTATLQVVPFPVLVIDQALIVRRASDAAMKEFQIRELPQTGVHLSQCEFPEQMSVLAQMCNDVFRFRAERRITFSSGHSVKRLAVSPFRNQTDDVAGVVVTLVDDFSSNEAIELLQRFGNVGHWQLQLSDNSVFWSDEVFRIHGVDPQEGVPNFDDAIAFYAPEDRPGIIEKIEQCAKNGEPFRILNRLTRRDGRTVMVQSVGKRITATDGTPLRIIGVFQNVTELTTIQLIVRQMEELQNELGFAFYSYDIMNKLPYWSAGLFEMLGHNPKTHIPSLSGLIDAFHHDDQIRIQNLIDAAIEKGEGFEFQARLVRRDRSVVKCRGEGHVAKNEAEASSHIYGNLRLDEA